jgi:hypothetical protein
MDGERARATTDSANRERGRAISATTPDVTVRDAQVPDIPAIEALIAHFARQNRMLFRTASD